MGRRGDNDLLEAEPLLDDSHLTTVRDPLPAAYIAVCRRDWYSHPYYCLYKVEDSSSSSSSPSPSPTKQVLHRFSHLPTDVARKTVVSLRSRWIVSVGGNPGDTVLFDTETRRVITGPKLLSAKLSPVAAAVEDRIYVLSSRPQYLEDPDFEPWFEVLDLSRATVVATADGRHTLDGCSWEALPDPICFPCMLSPAGYLAPPLILVTSYVLFLSYLLVSVNNMGKMATYAFDTGTHRWHKLYDYGLPFFGSATPLVGHNTGIFLGRCWESGPINAYRIRLVSSAPHLKLSVTEFPVKTEAREEVGVGEEALCLASMEDEGSFSCITFRLDDREHHMSYDKDIHEFYPRKMYLNLTTYKIVEGEETGMDIVVRCKRDKALRIFSSHGFSSPPIAFALSI
uniref:F-box associated domain-containing protein n=1 Tax=Oryza meridionalis TaxID=40149 RepID=A0A0E0CHC2_9ORYZ